MWTLIGHYQIRSSGRGLSTKQALKEFLNTLIPEYGIQNFNTDWNDGRALCGLVDRLQPGLCPNHRSLDPNNGLENCRLGMELAEEHLQIPKILDPEDLNDPQVDDLSVMTYVSYFFNPAMAQLIEWIKRKIPHRNIANVSTDWNNGINLAALMEACHPGLFPDWEELDPHKAKENLDKSIKLAQDRLDIACPVSAATLSDPKVDEIVVATYLSRFKYSKLLASANEVSVHVPTFQHGTGIVNQPVEFQVELGSTPELTLSHLAFKATANDSAAVVYFGKPHKEAATARFVPSVSGIYKVSCTLNDEEVTNGCPFEVPVIDPKQWSLSVNLPQSVQINKPINFEVLGEAYGTSPVVSCTAYIDTGVENPPEPAIIEEVEDKANHTEPAQEESIVTGLDKPAVIGEDFSFSVKVANKEELDALIQGPTVSYTPEIEEVGDGNGDWHTVTFVPDEQGAHTLDVTIGGNEVQGSPFTVSVVDEIVEEIDGSNLSEAKGDNSGDDQEKENKRNGKQEEQSKETELKREEKPKEKASFVHTSISPVESGKCNVYLVPTGIGKAKTHVTIGGVEVENSPFDITISDASKCSMSGLEDRAYLLGEEITFTVSTQGAGEDKPTTEIRGQKATYSPVVVENKGEEGKYSYTFMPTEPGIVKLAVLFGGEHIPGSPTTLQVGEPSIISEIPRFLEVGKAYSIDIMIDSSVWQEPTFLVTGLDGNTTNILDGSIFRSEDQSNQWKLVLKPLDTGSATVEVKLGNHNVKKSPFPVKITSISECSVEGIDRNPQLGLPYTFNVNVAEGLTQIPEVKLYTTSSQSALTGIENEPNSHAYTFTPVELGTVKIAILFGGVDIPGSPFDKVVEAPTSAKSCRAYGPALHPNAVLESGRPIEFYVDCKKAGDGELQIIAQGPRKNDPKVLVAEEEGVYTLRIDALHPGWYHVHVWWSQVHIPKSPFHLKVHQASDPSKVRAYGPGVSDQIEVDRPAEFHILTKEAGMGTLSVIVHGVKNAFRVNVKPEDPIDPRTLRGVYHPQEAGDYKVIIKWSGTEIPGSPFSVTVTDKRFDIEQARIEERRKERAKRVEAQQKLVRRQNKAVKKAINSMPDFGNTSSLQMRGPGGQFASKLAVVPGQTTTKKMVHMQKRKRLTRNVTASSVMQTTSLGDATKEKHSRKISAPPRLTKGSAVENNHPMSKTRYRNTQGIESAMQKNAGILGDYTPIGGSLKGGVSPMWHASFIAEEASNIESFEKEEELEPVLTHHSLSATWDENIDSLPDELPVPFQPMYDSQRDVERKEDTKVSTKTRKTSKRKK